MKVRRYCDVQMATKKNYLRYCGKAHCKECPCCIEVNSEGQKSHIQAGVKRQTLYVPDPLKGHYYAYPWN